MLELAARVERLAQVCPREGEQHLVHERDRRRRPFDIENDRVHLAVTRLVAGGMGVELGGGCEADAAVGTGGRGEGAAALSRFGRCHSGRRAATYSEPNAATGGTWS